MDLFRKEAIDHQAGRLHGEVALTTPLPAWAFAGLLAAIVAGIALALILVSYARKETVSGWLTPDKGLARIVAPEPGVVEAVHVAEGESVAAGAALVTLVLDAGLAGEASATAKGLAELDKEIAELSSRLDLVRRTFANERALSETARASAARELEQLQIQRAAQDERLSVARELLANYEALAVEEAASKLEVARQRESYLIAQQGRAQISQALAAKTAEIEAFAARLKALPDEEAAALSEIREGLAGLRGRRSLVERQGRVVLAAPVAGRVATLPVREGMSLEPRALAAAILPAGGRLQAELFAPTRAAGFIREGQDVRVQLDAFPFRKFGTATGEVARISKTIFDPAELPVELGLNEPVYRVLVDLDAQIVDAYGDEFPLQPGMTLKADIVLERRPLWRVLLDPVLSAVR